MRNTSLTQTVATSAPTLTLTAEQAKQIRDYVSLSNKLDSKSITIFEICINMFKDNKGTKKETIKSSLKKQFNKLFKDKAGNVLVSKYILTKLTKIIDISSDYDKFNIIYKTDTDDCILYYSNIEAIVKLLAFCSLNSKDLVTSFNDIRIALDSVISNEAELNKVTLNNTLKDTITKIKLDNNIAGDEDDFTFKGGYTELLAMIKSQFKGDIKKLISDLSDIKE